MKGLTTILTLGAAFALNAAGVCYVDCTRPDDSGDGMSEATAKQTIQGAIDVCTAQGVREVVVLPGVYDKGVSDDGKTGRSRIYVNGNDYNLNGLRVYSRDGAEKTIVKGAFDPDSDWYGAGPKAVRCLTVRGGRKVVFQGFTFCNGASAGTAAAHGDDGNTVRGGAAFATAGVTGFTLVDCVISNNFGTRGGALCGGTAVRCRIVENRASNFGAAAREAALYNCLVARNRIVGGDKTVATLAYPKAVVNCTIVDNDGLCEAQVAASNAGGPVYNCVIDSKDGVTNSRGSDAPYFHNCVIAYDKDEYFAEYGDNCKTCNSTEIFCPFMQDYRIATNSVSVGAGDAAWLSSAPADYRYQTLDGVALPESGAIDAGCFGLRAKPATAAIVFNGAWGSGYMTLNGRTLERDQTHFASETAPVKLTYRAVFTQDVQKVTRYLLKRNGADFDVAMVPAYADDAFELFAPPVNGTEYWAVEPKRGTTLFVDKQNAADETADGTAAHPYATIQQAVDAALALKSEACVSVAPGVYDEGETFQSSMSNRVAVAGHAGTGLRIFSQEGAEKTIIAGANDPDTVGDEKYEGCGPKAVRCVTVDQGGVTIFQGFTLAGGRGSKTETDGDDNTGAIRGGGVFVPNGGDAWFDLCTITNCVASRGAATSRGTFYRCRITGCRPFNNGVARNATFRGCVFDGNWGKDITGNGSSLYQCTAINNRNEEAWGYSTIHYCTECSWGNVAGANTWYDVFNTPGSGSSYKDLYIARQCYNFYQKTNAGAKLNETNVRDADPYFVDAEHGDGRVYACSKAARLLPISVAQENWSSFLFRDLTGREYHFNADGTTVAGAYAETPAAVVAESDRESGVSPAAPVPVTEAGTVEFSATADRPLVGWKVGGETIASTERTFTLAVAPQDAEGDAFGALVEPVYGNTWFVDAEHGDDANAGYAAADAKRTLASMFAKTFEKGDVVKALPGTYADGTMPTIMGGSHLCRVAVGANVTLESAEGPEKTIIKGESDPSGDSYGLGPNAVRCVDLSGTLRGFTIADGRSDSGAERNDARAGGVLAGGVVYDCIFTNCCATRGGALYTGRAVRCRFIDNACTGNGAAARNAVVVDSFADGNLSPAGNDYGVFCDCRLENCTIGPNNRRENGAALYGNCCFGGASSVNCVFAGAEGISEGVSSNCAFVATVKNYKGTVWNAIKGDVSMDANGVPLKTSVAVDAAMPELCRFATGSDTDLYGRQRVWNAKQDVGCCDYDWRGDYAKTLKDGGVSVTTADPLVALSEAGTRVTLHDGELAAVWNAPARMGRFTFACEVKGEGTLVVTLNGETLASFTKADGARSVTFANKIAANALAFSYAGSATDAGAEVGAFERTTGTALIIR